MKNGCIGFTAWNDLSWENNLVSFIFGGSLKFQFNIFKS